MKVVDIPGWFTFADVYKDAINHFGDNSVFVEIGAWLGSSTAFMAEGIKRSYKKIQFYTVDTWLGSPSERDHLEFAKNNNLYEMFLENMRKVGVSKFVYPIRGESTAVAKQFLDNSVDFIFIDGEHENDGCLKDIEAWYPKLRSNGFMGGHDFSHPNVKNNVIHFFGDNFVEIELNNVWMHYND